METLYKGQRYSMHIQKNTGLSYIESEEGRHYCDDDHCQYCESSTPGVDAHEFRLEFPERDFQDDLGNTWQWVGQVSHDYSPSFGWSRTTCRWTCNSPKPASPVDIKKIRRRVEDALRKQEDWRVLQIAAILGVRLD